MSPRTANRRFTEALGMTPIQWLLHQRVRQAQALLETTRSSVEKIVAQAGFGSAPVFRKHFRKVVGMSPVAYRKAFGHHSVDRAGGRSRRDAWTPRDSLLSKPGSSRGLREPA